jgi:hypothetical protein
MARSSWLLHERRNSWSTRTKARYRKESATRHLCRLGRPSESPGERFGRGSRHRQVRASTTAGPESVAIVVRTVSARAEAWIPESLDGASQITTAMVHVTHALVAIRTTGAARGRIRPLVARLGPPRTTFASLMKRGRVNARRGDFGLFLTSEADTRARRARTTRFK